ncbi:hypothetical protein MK139_17130, partial [bacterium]|nr:hypothetical protein [bacterium]
MTLTAEDKDFFKDNGYLVKHDTLTEDQIQAGIDEIWKHLEAERDDPSSWLNAGPIRPKCGDTPEKGGDSHETTKASGGVRVEGPKRNSRVPRLLR